MILTIMMTDVQPEKLKRVNFALPEQLYWKVKNWQTKLKTPTWAAFLEKVVEILEELEKREGQATTPHSKEGDHDLNTTVSQK